MMLYHCVLYVLNNLITWFYLQIDRIEERRLNCKNHLERAEFRQRKEQLSDEERYEDLFYPRNDKINLH